MLRLTQVYRHRCFFRFTGRGRIPLGRYPLLSYPSFSGGFTQAGKFFSGAPGGYVAFPAGDPDGARLSLLADVLIPELSAAPSFSRFTSRQGCALTVAFLSWTKEPFANVSSLHPLRIRFLQSPSHSAGLPTGGVFRRNRVARTKFPFLLSKKQTFLD